MWLVWLIIAGVLFIGEILTSGFLLLWFAIAAVIAMLAPTSTKAANSKAVNLRMIITSFTLSKHIFLVDCIINLNKK